MSLEAFGTSLGARSGTEYWHYPTAWCYQSVLDQVEVIGIEWLAFSTRDDYYFLFAIIKYINYMLGLVPSENETECRAQACDTDSNNAQGYYSKSRTEMYFYIRSPQTIIWLIYIHLSQAKKKNLPHYILPSVSFCSFYCTPESLCPGYKSSGHQYISFFVFLLFSRCNRKHY